MMLRSVIGIACATMVCTAASAADITGSWQRDDGNARVRIAPCGSQMCATNTWIKDPSSGEAVGDRLVMSVKKTGEGAYSGSAYDSKRKLNMSMTLKVTGNRLNSRGCVVGGIICRNVNWTAMK